MEVGMIFQFIVNGLLIGAIYAVIAMSFSIAWGVLHIVNLAHGEFVMIGAYVTYLLVKSFGLNPLLTVPVAIPILFVTGYAFQRFLIHEVAIKSIFATLLLTYGIAISVENIGVWLFKADPRTLTTGYGGQAISLGSVHIPLLRLIVFIFSVGIVVTFYYWLLKTKTGKAIRATRDNREAAQLVGINILRIHTITLGATAVVAGLVGCMLTLIIPISPYMGFPYTLRSFLICAFAGVGNIPAAFIGGLLLGVLESLVSAYISPALKEAIMFIILVIILVLRPRGLFGGV